MARENGHAGIRALILLALFPAAASQLLLASPSAEFPQEPARSQQETPPPEATPEESPVNELLIKGRALVAEKKFEEAEVEFRAALNLEPDTADVRFALADLFEKT